VELVSCRVLICDRDQKWSASTRQSLLRSLLRPPFLLSLADLLPSRRRHLSATFPRCSFRKVRSRAARSFAERRWHAAAGCVERRKMLTDRSYLRLKFFDSSRGTDPSEFLELRCWSGHMWSGSYLHWIASANAVAQRSANTEVANLIRPVANDGCPSPMNLLNRLSCVPCRAC
jgi:hypothetical protein